MFNYLTRRNRSTVENGSKSSRTQQHFQEEVNINTIVQKYQRTGVLPTIQGQPQYGDFTGLDFRSAQDKIANATQAFAQLPAIMRKRFHNDPANLVDFIQDPNNYEEACRLGLCEKRKPEVKNVPESAQNSDLDSRKTSSQLSSGDTQKAAGEN